MEEAECVSWDFEAQGMLLTTLINVAIYNATGGFGSWTNRGCNTTFDRSSNTVRCNCNHLTNFGALVVRN